MQCAECGKPNAEGAKFCMNCGASQVGPVGAGDSDLKPLDTEVEHIQREFAGSRGAD